MTLLVPVQMKEYLPVCYIGVDSSLGGHEVVSSESNSISIDMAHMLGVKLELDDWKCQSIQFISPLNFYNFYALGLYTTAIKT